MKAMTRSRMRSLRLLAGLIVGLLLCAPTLAPRHSAGSFQEAKEPRSQPAKPPDVPFHWRGLIGEYSLGVDTACLLETHGQLAILTRAGVLVTLQEEQPETYSLATPSPLLGRSIVVRRGESGLATAIETERGSFRRLSFGEGTGFKIQPLQPIDTLRARALRAKPPVERGVFLKPDLVEIATLDSTVKLDIRYASTNNFMGAVFYSQSRAFLQRPAAEALVRAHRDLKKQRYGLLIHDAYRPWYVTKMFWDATPNSQKIFVADPAVGSRHNRGCAVDISLYDLATGKPVEMVSGYDEFSHRSFSSYRGGTSLQRWHRDLLRVSMEAQGFKVYEWEWWHFDFKEWKRYPIGTVTFEEIH